MNTYFQFKQFIIHQDKTAMKVCTDACLLGAWVADKVENKKFQPKNILDIGCGTGLLSLMLAQKTEAAIDAVEIDENAYLQAKENISLSISQNQITIFKENIVDYKSQKKYDLIICNPPFFAKQLKSQDDARNIAMHGTQLSFADLAYAIKNNLAENAVAAALLPYYAVNEFAKICKKENLFINEQLNVSHAPTHPFFRTILLLSVKETAITEHFISIKNNDNEYSVEFKKLLKDYYLYL